MGNVSNFKIAVTGADGLLGTELSRYLSFIPLTHKDIEIRDEDNVNKVLSEINPDLTVHLAAISKATEADDDRTLAHDTNVIGTRNVAKASKHVIYMSTDYVFDGTYGGMYREHDTPNPQTYIGETKYKGELEVKHHAKRFTIIRTSFKTIPYPHSVVPHDMWSSADYVPIIAYQLAECIKHYDELPQILHIGTERKRLVDLASKTRNITHIQRKDILIDLPYDCSLNTSEYKKLCLNWE